MKHFRWEKDREQLAWLTFDFGEHDDCLAILFLDGRLLELQVGIRHACKCGANRIMTWLQRLCINPQWCQEEEEK